MRQLTTWRIFGHVQRTFHNWESNCQPFPWDLGIPAPSSCSLGSSHTTSLSFVGVGYLSCLMSAFTYMLLIVWAFFWLFSLTKMRSEARTWASSITNFADMPMILCQPKTHTLECVLVQVGGWGLHVVDRFHNASMCNSNHPIGINIKHTTSLYKSKSDKYL